MRKSVLFSILLVLIQFLVSGCESNKEQVNAPVQPISYDADINLNGSYNELADAVLFSNYFVYGKGVFTVDSTRQIAATDVNKDGTPLSLADLVLLTRLVMGDSMAVPVLDTLHSRFEHTAQGVIRILDDVKFSAALIVVGGHVTPVLLANNMEMNYNYDGAATRILIWNEPIYSHVQQIQSFSGDFICVSGGLLSIEVATDEGQPAELEGGPFLSKLNSYYNPFESLTTITFLLLQSGEADIFIVDEQDVVVFKNSGHYWLGFNYILWDGKNYDGSKLPNGKYICSLRTSDETTAIEIDLQR